MVNAQIHISSVAQVFQDGLLAIEGLGAPVLTARALRRASSDLFGWSDGEHGGRRCYRWNTCLAWRIADSGGTIYGYLVEPTDVLSPELEITNQNGVSLRLQFEDVGDVKEVIEGKRNRRLEGDVMYNGQPLSWYVG